MANCKDCVHVEVCEDFTKAKLSPERAEELLPVLREHGRICDHFKDRSRFVELPCMVGDTVYVLKGEHIEFAHVIAIYLDSSGGMFDLKIFKEIAINFYISKYNTFENIGKTVFLTLEEAEQALKERETNE